MLIEGIKCLSREFGGKLAVQTMILKIPDAKSLSRFAEILLEILPDEVQLNLPLRPVPKSYSLENRGNRTVSGCPSINLKTIGSEEVVKIQETLFRLTNLPVLIPPISQNSGSQKP